MGYIEHKEERSFYIEEDGTVWDSPNKTTQFNPDTREPISVFLPETAAPKIEIPELVVVKRKAGRPKKAVI